MWDFHMRTIHRDCELENAMLFGEYVMVLRDGKMKGGGLVEAYDENEVVVGSQRFSRSIFIFVVTLPPQCPMM
ncbi:hypothetical protein [Paenibacillus aceris]|uniref:Uncharacterized protein n=1 Tax=Paenibacillus aceris TaxID=869555 RepID=A0ABS4I7X4_9BACL|nr:hypothetical protein [Paenibacillus aceris]MBP1966938.1 hypothetical protein [Paenibacillus aceris]NHW39302.1 hypothetical protein [Paenibacillus aceris]